MLYNPTFTVISNKSSSNVLCELTMKELARTFKAHALETPCFSKPFLIQFDPIIEESSNNTKTMYLLKWKIPYFYLYGMVTPAIREEDAVLYKPNNLVCIQVSINDSISIENYEEIFKKEPFVFLAYPCYSGDYIYVFSKIALKRIWGYYDSRRIYFEYSQLLKEKLSHLGLSTKTIHSPISKLPILSRGGSLYINHESKILQLALATIPTAIF